MVVALSIEGATSVSLLAIFVGLSSSYRLELFVFALWVEELEYCILKQYHQFIDLIPNEDGKYKIKKQNCALDRFDSILTSTSARPFGPEALGLL